ncbi:MAG: cyclic nucleotide-binding domain-containing protein, partial [Cyanobacteria bacterium NC_groundwater_1444_Ag_S-0.65um_54_12]|nr:cyclic nucleotide-binding domain-containing protein [Cyanobacteria bacterium NC_groundwater_1444_Ag_S-0.65um_54_12]
APAGLEKTVVLGEYQETHSETQEILDILSRVDLFRDFPMSKAAELYSMIHRQRFKAGERVIAKGTRGDRFYVIMRGKAIVQSDGSGDRAGKIYGPYDYFGETALVLDILRTADVYAKTDLEVLAMARHDFLYFLRGTEIMGSLRRLARVRKLVSWDLLGNSAAFCQLTATQKTQLQSIMEDIEITEGNLLAKEGERMHYCYLVAEGQVEVLQEGRQIEMLVKGDFSGEIIRLLNGGIGLYTLRAASPGTVYRIPRRGMTNFLRKNPGIYVRLTENCQGR